VIEPKNPGSESSQTVENRKAGGWRLQGAGSALQFLPSLQVSELNCRAYPESNAKYEERAADSDRPGPTQNSADQNQNPGDDI